MSNETQDSELLTAKQLRTFGEDAAKAERAKAAANARRAEEQQKQARQAFMQQELRSNLTEYLMTTAKRHAEQGQHTFLAIQFSAALLADGGRRVNNSEADWPDSLQGFAKRAYEYFQQHLEPAGYHLSARILDYPHGNLGDVGLFLSW